MKVVLAALVVAVIAAAAGFWWWSKQVQPVNPGNEEAVAFVVTKDQTGSEIISNLATQGLIRSPIAAKIFLYISDLQNKLQAGSFVLAPNQSLAEVFKVLTGPATDVWVTFPEGWRNEQIALRLESALGSGDTTTFDIDQFLVDTKNLEGQLFPDTYLIPRAASSSDVIRMMTANFVAKTQIDPASQIDVVNLAALVEREGNSNEDRPTIAGVLDKRLKAGWPLQVDATVQYAQDNDRCKAIAIKDCKYWEPVTNSKFPSIYNTYLHQGLPPTPIANPGLAAIQAALNPPETPYWFYIHDSEGQVHFAKTAEEHSANIDKYLR